MEIIVLVLQLPRTVARVFKDAGVRFFAHDGHVYCSHLSFMALFAFFPFLIFLATLAGYIATPDTAKTFASLVLSYFPSEIRNILVPITAEILTEKRGDLLTVCIVSALWFSSSGVEALRAGLNRAYGTSHRKSFLYGRVFAMSVVVIGVITIIFVSCLILIGPNTWGRIFYLMQWPVDQLSLWSVGRYAFGATLQFCVITLLYRWLPDCNPNWRYVWPGAATATVLWLFTASMFGIYIHQFGQFSIFYGSLGGVMATLTFLYLSGAVFIYGAEINGSNWERSGQ